VLVKNSTEPGVFTLKDIDCKGHHFPDRPCLLMIEVKPPKARGYTGDLVIQVSTGAGGGIGLKVSARPRWDQGQDNHLEPGGDVLAPAGNRRSPRCSYTGRHIENQHSRYLVGAATSLPGPGSTVRHRLYKAETRRDDHVVPPRRDIAW